MEIRLSQRAAWAAGQPISDLMARALAHPDLISLAAGFVDPDTLPCQAVRQAAQRLLADEAQARSALQYGTTHGDSHLREQILARWQASDGPRARRHVGLDQVVLTAGSNQLLYLLADTLLDPGDIVLTASPTYLVFLGIVNNVGARAMGVASDECGPIPEALEETLHNLYRVGLLPRVKAVYVVPYFNNPDGANIPETRRAELLRIVARWSIRQPIYVLADNAYRELRYQGPDVPSLSCFQDSGDWVVETGTFSKSFSPGLRVGWGIVPRALLGPLLDQKGNLDFGSPHLPQKLMAVVLEDGSYGEHLQKLRQAYAAKLQAMLDAADEFLGGLPGVRWRRPQGGLYVWVELPAKIHTGPDGPLFDAALQKGVLYVPGQFCHPSDGRPQGTNTLRLSFGVQPPDRIRAGMKALADALHQLLTTQERIPQGEQTPGAK